MIVVDASIAILWTQTTRADPRAAQAKDLLDAWAGQGMRVPPVFPYEAANVIHHKRPVGTREHRQRAVQAVLDTVRIVAQSIPDVARLAEAHGLSVYDAAYLELAERHGWGLVTEDKTLHRAGKAALGPKRCLRLAEAAGGT